MIFKTFDGKIDKWTAKIGIFGKSFNELGSSVSNAFESVIDNIDNFDENVGFWENLKQNLFAKKGSGKDWIKNSLGQIISKENIDSYIKELDLDSAKEKLTDIFDWENLVKNGDATWSEYFETLKDGTEKYIPDLIKNTDDLSKLTGEDLVEANQQARSSALAHNEAIKAQTFSAKAGNAAFQALATAGNMLAMWLLSEVISAVYSCITASDRLKESARDLGGQFSSSRSDIEGYRSQISDLYKIINDSSSSYEDTCDARRKLLAIQDEMIEKFGSEAEAARLVTDAVNGQADAFDTLTQKQWEETVDRFNYDSGRKWTEKFGDAWANFTSGSANNYERMQKQLEDTTVNFDVTPKLNDAAYQEFIKKIKDIFGAKVQGRFDALSHRYIENISLSGDLDDIYRQMQNIRTLAENMGLDDSYVNALSARMEKTKSTLDSYQEFYDQSILQDRILADDSYEQSFRDINDAYKNYQDAFASGDSEAVEKAKQAFAEVVQKAAEGAADDSVADFFLRMYPDLQDIVSGWLFEVHFRAALEDDGDDFEDDVKDAASEFGSSDDILSFNAKNATDGQIEAYAVLQQIASDYQTNIAGLVARMQELGIISSQVKNSLRDKFSAGMPDTAIGDWINALTEEEAGLAGSAAFEEALARRMENLDGAALSAADYSAALEEVKAWQDGLSTDEVLIPSPSLSSTIDQLNTQLKPTFDSLRSAYQNIFTNDGFTPGNVDISTLDSIRSKLEELNAIDGISIDYSSFDNLARVLADTSSTADDVQKAFNLFATDIVDGLSPALSDCSGENYKLIQSLLESAGIMNAEEVMVSSLGYAYEDYAAAKKECADAGIDLAGMSEQEIEDLVAERLEAENCGQALALLQLKKALCNETALNPGSDINSLYRLAKAAGIATENIAMLAGLNDAYEKEAAAGNTPAALAIMHKMEQVKADVEKQFSEPDSVQVEFGSKEGSLSQAAEKAETDWKSLLDRETSLLEKQLDAHLITLQEYTDKRRGIIEDYYRDGKIRAEEYYGALESMYSDQLSLHDRAVSAVTGSIDAEIDRLKDRKEAVEESHQAKIDAIQSEIDALNKANDARKEQIDLEKARYEAGRARSQRVNKVFDGGQFVYAADGEAIRDAENDLADREFRLNISLLEGQIDSLKAEMENATMSLDDV